MKLGEKCPSSVASTERQRRETARVRVECGKPHCVGQEEKACNQNQRESQGREEGDERKQNLGGSLQSRNSRTWIQEKAREKGR